LVNERDALITGVILLVTGFLAVNFAGQVLPGTQAANLVCELPGSNSLQLCDRASASGDYTVSTEVTVDRLDINKVYYKTTPKTGFTFSALDTSDFAFPAETRNAKVDYVLRDSEGRIISSDTKRFGVLTGSERETVIFESSVSGSGDYNIELAFTGEGCGLIACAPVSSSFERTVEVPNLPLDNWDRLEVNFR